MTKKKNEEEEEEEKKKRMIMIIMILMSMITGYSHFVSKLLHIKMTYDSDISNVSIDSC